MLAASTIAGVARVVLGAAFIVAAGAKIAIGRRWVDQASAAGTPRVVAAVVPWLELAVGSTLVAGLATPWPAVVAIGLLIVFTAWIVSRLAAGQHAPCACFGAISAAPLSWWHAARNVALIALAILATAR